MSGHNKFSKIKHRKAATDAQKSKIFTKMARIITVEAKKANGNLTSPGLKAAIEKARSFNVPNDTIDRAVKKASGNDVAAMESVTYEGYGPGGCALIIDGLTENRNRTAQEVKHIFAAHQLELAAPGSASWAFTKQPGEGWVPNMTTPLSESDAEQLEKLIDDLNELDDIQDVYTNAE
jgi:YebC/PmpR family DNA-binding regulatory protein